MTTIEAAQVGKRDADFTALLEAHSTKLHASCLRLTRGNRADADDLFQAVSVKAFRSFAQLDDPARFLAWCRRIATNTWTDMHRRSRETVSIHELHLLDQRDYEAEVVDVTARRQAIDEFLAGLSAEKRTILTERAEGVSAKDLAARLNVASAAVDTAFSRLRTRAREAMSALVEAGALVVGPLIPARLRYSRHRLRVSRATQSVDGVAVSQLGALIAAGVLAASGVIASVVVTAPVSRPTGLPERVVSDSSTVRQDVGLTAKAVPIHITSGEKRVMGVSTADTQTYKAHHCGFVADCSDNGSISVAGGKKPGDKVVYAWVPIPVCSASLGCIGGDYFLDPSVDPSDVPSSPAALQDQFLGNPSGVDCDSSLLTNGKTCDGRDLAQLVNFLIETNREGAVGDQCQANSERGRNIPVVCDKAQPIPAT